ncbi:MAG TPA: DUF2938 domain-containing protein [Halomonas campaniensis]|uniref:DUF2938 domain-containing protein n=1 Tax=Halomonas campaniensis TaxID=213554 RepID=A0A3D0KHV5_9GAMM|nr:DUF2938 domain-containing protein [Halomonas sp. 3F2F]HCA03098.1 DUF2938 domain-containing protein [Halomonas campaniensis]
MMLTDALLLGLGATAFMDIVALLQKRLLGIPSLNYAMVGRWLGHLPKGRFIHRPIGESAPIQAEMALGWLAHYLIGVAFAIIFLVLVGPNWLARPSLIPALGFGVITVMAPFLVLQPGMGAGVAASKTPQPTTARLRSLFAHASFGAGLWVAGVLVMRVL